MKAWKKIVKSKFEWKPNCLVVAGEKSGEEHFLSFFPQLRSVCPEVSWWGVGGNLMGERGVELLYHLKDFSTWGFSEVFQKIPFYMKALKNICQQVSSRGTRAAIFVDFQGFNLRLAKKLSKQGVMIFYYVAPQAWAWKSGRVSILKNSVHTLFTILPFEKKWFQKRGVQRVLGVAHPLLVEYRKDLPAVKKKNAVPVCLLLPGSRNFEVELLLPRLIKAVESLKQKMNVKVSLVIADNVSENLYSPYRNKVDRIYKNEQLSVALTEADYALAASGTVTLAAALFAIPTIVLYKGSLLNEFIFYSLIRYKGFVCLPNIISREEIFPELLQNKATSFNIEKRLLRLMSDEKEYQKVQEKLLKMRQSLEGECEDCGRYIGEYIKEAYEKSAG